MAEKEIIERWAEAQSTIRELPCPRCGIVQLERKHLTRHALSRRADIYICDACGLEEAMEDAKRRERVTPEENAQYLTKWYCVKVERMKEKNEN